MPSLVADLACSTTSALIRAGLIRCADVLVGAFPAAEHGRLVDVGVDPIHVGHDHVVDVAVFGQRLDQRDVVVSAMGDGR
jgi:hypothetical protein